MITYKNNGMLTKKFYEVEFKPGSTHEVKGFINDSDFVRVNPIKKEAKAEVKLSEKKEETKVEAKSEVKETSKAVEKK